MHSAFCTRLASPQTSPVFTALLLEPFLEPQIYMNSVFLIFLLVSLMEIVSSHILFIQYTLPLSTFFTHKQENFLFYFFHMSVPQQRTKNNSGNWEARKLISYNVLSTQSRDPIFCIIKLQKWVTVQKVYQYNCSAVE